MAKITQKQEFRGSDGPKNRPWNPGRTLKDLWATADAFRPPDFRYYFELDVFWTGTGASAVAQRPFWVSSGLHGRFLRPFDP